MESRPLSLCVCVCVTQKCIHNQNPYNRMLVSITSSYSREDSPSIYYIYLCRSTHTKAIIKQNKNNITTLGNTICITMCTNSSFW